MRAANGPHAIASAIKLSDMKTTPPLTETLPERLAKHRAVKAWAALNPERVVPESIETLKFKRIESKSAVYRLNGVGPDGSTIIAKRCLAATASLERRIYVELLPSLPVPALRCFGSLPEASGEFCWLFIEDAGTNRYSTANDEHRALAARWLGALHRTVLPDGLRD